MGKVGLKMLVKKLKLFLSEPLTDDMRFFKIQSNAGRPGFQVFCFSLFLLLLTLGFSSCSKSIVRTKRLMGQKLDIKVSIADNVNQNSAVAFSALLVYDKKLFEQLKNMSAKNWIEERVRLRNEYPKEKKSFQSWDWEWAPGQWVGVIELPLKPSAVGGIMFADYSAEGKHRIVFDPHKSVKVNLLEKNFTVKPD